MEAATQTGPRRFARFDLPTLTAAAVWLAATFAAFALAAKNTNIFNGDECPLIPYIVGAEPITPKYLWSQWNEHRIPLPRLLMFAAYAASGGDFRAPAFLGVAVASALALVLLAAAKRVRGRTSYRDTFYPVAVLTLAQHENFLYGFQIAFFVGTFLAGVVLAVIATTPTTLTFRSAMLVIACLIALPLCGAQGVMWSAPLGLWLIVAGLRARRLRLLLAVGAVGIYALLACYFIGLKMGSTPAPGAAKFVRSVLQFFYLCVGRPGSNAWPAVGTAVALLYAATLGLVSWVILKRKEERLRASGMLLFLLAGGLQAAGVAWGRAEMPEANAVFWTSRYVTLAVPMICGIYFAWGLYGVGRLRFVQPAILVTLLAFTPFTVKYGFRFANMQYAEKSALDGAMRAGLPVTVVAHRFAEMYHLAPDESHATSLRLLAGAGIAPFKHMDVTTEIEERRVVVNESFSHGITWQPAPPRADGADAHFVVELGQPRFVYAVRLRYRIVEPASVASVTTLSWDKEFGNGRSGADRFSNYSGKEAVHTFLVNETIGRFRVSPFQKPCAFEIGEMIVIERKETR